MKYNQKDFYYNKAKKEGFKARAAYKLMQIQQRFKIIKQGDSVLDIACAPGSWLQVIKKLTNGVIVGIDLEKIKPIPRVKFIQADINKVELDQKFNVVVSDIAPKTSGIKKMDQDISYDLSLQALELARKVLIKNGNFVTKNFQGNDTKKLQLEMKKYFKTVKTYTPEATRQGSKEVYLIGLNYYIH